jgi:hypothetical protein
MLAQRVDCFSVINLKELKLNKQGHTIHNMTPSNNSYEERDEADVFRKATFMRHALRMIALILS